ncbi:MAG TPA: hypothetical protein VM689_25750 [Aliidongia sp.]|nr:hypothetical protein [Aliidongia sp.]
MPKLSPPATEIEIKELAPEKVGLAVIFDGQRFECGTYLNRAAAQQAAKLFIARKEGERSNRKTPRKR